MGDALKIINQLKKDNPSLVRFVEALHNTETLREAWFSLSSEQRIVITDELMSMDDSEVLLGNGEE